MEMADSRTQVNKCARERHTCAFVKGVGAKGGEYHGHGRGGWGKEVGGEEYRERQPQPGIFIFLFLMLAQPAGQTCSGP